MLEDKHVLGHTSLKFRVARRVLVWMVGLSSSSSDLCMKLPQVQVLLRQKPRYEPALPIELSPL
jgi:hypothetical protein